jgi:hypothetical protein
MRSAQTRSQMQYFPIKAYQPEIQFTVIFTSEKEWEAFQRFIRENQVRAQSTRGRPGVTLNWPERSIVNWTGLVTKFKAGGMRYNYTPRATFTVQLVESLVSNETKVSSWGSDWTALFSGDTSSAVEYAVVAAQSILRRFIPGA